MSEQNTPRKRPVAKMPVRSELYEYVHALSDEDLFWFREMTEDTFKLLRVLCCYETYTRQEQERHKE